jgi:hypothetical protein
MAVPEAFRALVEKYEFQRPTISRSQYNETQLRLTVEEIGTVKRRLLSTT